MPGSTPTAVPSVTPISAYSSIIGSAAVTRPCIRKSNALMA
jgi:hypothetical protein